MEQLWRKDKSELFALLESNEHGLSDREVKARLNRYGENKLQEAKQKTVLQVFLEQFRDLLVLILLAAAIISALTDGLEGAVVILSVLLLNAVLGTVQHFKAQKSLDSLQSLSAPSARVIRDGSRTEIASSQIVPGDVLLLEAGDLVAADGRILENYSLQVNESALTGEAEVVHKTDQVIDAQMLPLGDRLNMVYGGSLVSYGRGVVLVTATGMQTEVGKIAHLMEETKEKKTPLERSMHQFSKTLSIAVLLVCGVIFLLGVWRALPIGESLLFAVALAVAAIPEALGSIVTIGLAIGTQKMAKEHAIVKDLRAVESLGCVSVICSDKTGTLTQNNMTVQQVYLPGKVWNQDTADTNETAFAKLIECSVLCNDGTFQGTQAIGDPTETALLAFCKHLGWEIEKVRTAFPRVQEIPFDSERKLMSTLHQSEQAYQLYTKGAPDVLLARCIVDDDLKEAIHAQIENFSSQGLRVLAFAGKSMWENRALTVEDEQGLDFMGLMAMMDPPRPETADAVEKCRRAGIRPVMITGDHKVTAAAIARQIGILQNDDRIVEGVELDKISDEALRNQVETISVYARVTPEHKIRIVRAWQENDKIVAMTGDGVNDAPALKQADIGIAMGITGTGVSKDAASMILTDDNFATIIKAVENGRTVYHNIKNAIHFLLSGNLAAILVVVYTSLLGLPLPFTAVQLLFINLLTDSLPALAINMEPPRTQILDATPRNPKEGILTKDFMKVLAREGGMIASVTLIGYYIGLQINGELACTMAFAVLCLTRLFHGFNCRGELSMVHLPKNIYSIGAFLLGAMFLLGVLSISSLYALFDISGDITLSNMAMIVCLAALPTVLIQCYRLVKVNQ